MRRLAFALIGLPLTLVSCSSSTSNGTVPEGPDTITLISPTSVVQATVDGSRVFGSQIELVRDESGLRGRGPLGIVDLRKQGDSLRGVVGGAPTELYIERKGTDKDRDAFTVRGLYSGTLGNLEVRSDRIEGQLGRCQYNLRRYASEVGAAYTGQRVCGQRYTEPATIALAPAIAAQEPIDKAALIAILLGR